MTSLPVYLRILRGSPRAVLALAASAVAFAGPAAAQPPAAQPPAARPPAARPADSEERQTLRVPAFDQGVSTLKARREEQLRAAGRFKVFHGFRFEDRQPESGITFMHRPVPEAGKNYQAVHYDHGNGVAVADVDGDGRYDIYFTSQLGRNELWRNLGGGRFEDCTAKAGVALADRVSVTASFADVDNDGDPDLFVTTVKMGNVLYENDGRGRFRDVTAKAGVGTVAHSSGAAFFDYDRDGLLDLLVTNVGVYTVVESRKSEAGEKYYLSIDDAFGGHLRPERTEHNQLFRNLGRGADGTVRFEDVSKQAGLEDGTWCGDAAFADLNGDHYPDLYVLNMQGDDRYYENAAGKRFVDKSAEVFPRSPWGSMGVKFFDYNNDGRLDLILTDMHSDMSRQVGPEDEKLKSIMMWTEKHLQGGANNIFGNAFWEALGDGSFEEVSDLVGAENYWPWGLSVGDLNADGFEDVFITASMNYPYRYGVNTVLLNNRGQEFLDSEFILGVEPRRGGRTYKPWFVVDCSGADREHERCQGREGKYEVLGALGTRSSVIFDLDDDGDLDVVTGEFGAEPQVLVSNLAEKAPPRFVKVELTGTVSNRDGLGAVVTVKAGERLYKKPADGKSGYLSQSSMPLYFGLGEAEKVDRIEVLWPTGEVQTVTEGVAMGSLVEIVEDSGRSRQ